MSKWKVIEEFPNYAVSNIGRIKRIKKGRNTYIGKILKNVETEDGYFIVNLYKNNKGSSKYIHRLVLEIFNPIKNMNILEVNHKDGNKENNNLSNLEWLTQIENINHAYKNNLMSNIGVNNGRSILNENTVIQIKHVLKNTNLSQEKIGQLYNISRSTISAIKTGRLWSHIRI